MYKLLIIVLCIFGLVGCTTDKKETEPTPVPTPSPTPTLTVEQYLRIDNPIIRFDILTNTPCTLLPVEDNNAYYCNVNDTIYYGNQLSYYYPEIVEYFALAHEDGHSEDTRYAFFNRTVFQMEQFADCYAGIDMAKLYQGDYIDLKDLQELKTFIDWLPPGDHGTPQQRYAAFAYGYLNGECRRF